MSNEDDMDVAMEPWRFWGAIEIMMKKPHLLNRRLCGAKILWIGATFECDSENLIESLEKIAKHFGVNQKGFEVKNKVFENEISTVKESLIKKGSRQFYLDDYDKIIDNLKNMIEVTTVENDFLNIENIVTSNDKKTHDRSHSSDSSKYPANVLVVIRKAYPKNDKRFSTAVEIIILDKVKNYAYFINERGKGNIFTLPKMNYSFKLSDSTISLECKNQDSENSSSNDSTEKYLKDIVLEKLIKWANEVKLESKFEDKGSLNLVDITQYNKLYQHLKEKYGRPLVEMWPESTDPLKYVYEDVAIASYLILIWEKERKNKGLMMKQSFVDVGCGNGLLVFILSEEGHPGLGIDLKKRKIWDLYPPGIKLQEKIVEPNDHHLMPEYDWLIGNHSDELTPWLPVIAMKSSYKTNFFVIPCCPFDFENKYLRKNSDKSQYLDYLDYVEEIGKVCGFDVLRDKLRIPSTKRVCFIGCERVYTCDDKDNVVEKINSFIKENCNRYSNTSKNSHLVSPENSEQQDITNSWTSNFKHRTVDPIVKNCTTVDDDIKKEIVSLVTDTLLCKKYFVEIDTGTNGMKKWNKGGTACLSDIAKTLNAAQLEALKKECGGLQTLLKNHSNIFLVRKGQVQLQVPKTMKQIKVAKGLVQSKPCWFHNNHPQSCPWNRDVCAYYHTIKS